MHGTHNTMHGTHNTVRGTHNTMHGTHNIKITPKYLHRKMFSEPTERSSKTKHFGGDVRLKAIKQGTDLLSTV
jgi:hypothetical protein